MADDITPPIGLDRRTLRHEQQSPDYVRGFMAEREGRGSDSNPYAMKSRAWSAGWLAAREHPFQEQPPCPTSAS